MKRHLLLLLILLLCCSCGMAAQNASSISETAEPAAPDFTAKQLSAFVIAGFDKEGPGDFGYQVRLTDEEQADFIDLMDVESWAFLESPPEHGFTAVLQISDADIHNIIYVMDGGELGTLIKIAPQRDGESLVFTAPAEVAQAAQKFSQKLKSQYIQIVSDPEWSAEQVIAAYFDAHYKSYLSMQDIDISGLLDMEVSTNSNLITWLQMLNQRRRLLKEHDLCYVETEQFDYQIVYDQEAEDDRMNFWQRRMDDDFEAVYHLRIRGEEGKAYPPTFALNSQHTILLKKIDGAWRIVRHYYPGAVRNFYFNNGLTLPTDEQALAMLKEEFAPTEQPEPLEVPENALPYDPQKAVQYALKYTEHPNPLYYNVIDWHGNCQNFVSQTVSSGFGFEGNPDPMTRDWFAGIGGGTSAWENCDYFWAYAVTNGGIGGQELSSVTQLQPGDVLQLRSLGRNDPDDFSHVIIMVDDEKYLFAQNSPANFVYYSDLVNIASRLFRPAYLTNIL